MEARRDNLFLDSLLITLLGLGVAAVAWGLLVSPMVPGNPRVSLWATAKDDWWYLTNRGWADMAQHINETWLGLVQRHYAAWLMGATLPGAAVVGGILAIARRGPWSLAHGVIGWAIGGLLAFLAGVGLTQLGDPPSIPAQLLGMPIASVVGCWAVTLLGARSLPDTSTLRGTRIEVLPADSSAAVKRAVRQGAVAFGGVVLKPVDEVSHFLAAGVTRTGKSLALREMIFAALARGNRVFVADPDGGAMKHFYTHDDIIMNPYDARSVKWDMFLEIEGPADYANLAATLLPLSGSTESAQWENWAQDIFAVCVRNWHENDLGTTDEFTDMMASASNEQLEVLCRGIEAARVFKPGMEKILGGILQTLSGVIIDLRLIAAGTGKPFSVRQWVREGKGSLWAPYMVTQITTLRRMVSWWTSLAVAEVMSMGESETRRMWFVVDELDALGPITDLDRAIVRGGKFGVCVALGLQTIAQVEGTYGKTMAAAIVENCDNKLFLRCNPSMGGGTAKFASDMIGESEIGRVETSNTQTEGTHGSSSSSMNVRRQVERAVLPSEMTQLPKREGYLKIQSDPVWKRVRIAITAYPTVIAPFVPIKLAGKNAKGRSRAAE